MPTSFWPFQEKKKIITEKKAFDDTGDKLRQWNETVMKNVESVCYRVSVRPLPCICCLSSLTLNLFVARYACFNRTHTFSHILACSFSSSLGLCPQLHPLPRIRIHCVSASLYTARIWPFFSLLSDASTSASFTLHSCSFNLRLDAFSCTPTF
jgi:hypothetical protein